MNDMVVLKDDRDAFHFAAHHLRDSICGSYSHSSPVSVIGWLFFFQFLFVTSSRGWAALAREL